MIKGFNSKSQEVKIINKGTLMDILNNPDTEYFGCKLYINRNLWMSQNALNLYWLNSNENHTFRKRNLIDNISFTF